MRREKTNRFEDLDVWKGAMKLATAIYREFKDCKDFSFKDQIQRAVVSIPSNIAEGYERQSNKEFIRFLYIAKGSSGEIRTQLYIAISLKYLDNESGTKYLEEAEKISAMLYKLIQYRSKL